MAQARRKAPVLRLPSLVPAPQEAIQITTGTPTAAWIIVTPAMAMDWLENHNVNNRKVREDHVARLAADMKAGKWRGRNGEPVKFDTEGRMFEGQHRCWACVQADTPFETLLITGCAPDDYNTSGIGRPKCFADFLGPVHGEKNVYLLASTLRLVYSWGHGQLNSKHCVASISELEVTYRNHPNLPHSVSRVGIVMRSRLMNQSHAALIHYAATLENHHSLVENFLERVNDGIGLMEDDPAYQLRRFLLTQKSPRPGARRSAQTYMLALAIKAWNAYKEHRPMKALALRSDENFPQL